MDFWLIFEQNFGATTNMGQKLWILDPKLKIIYSLPKLPIYVINLKLIFEFNVDQGSCYVKQF